MTIEEIKEDAVRFENLARAYYIRAIQAYLSKFKRKLHAADKLAGYPEIFDGLESQSLNKLKLTFAKIVVIKCNTVIDECWKVLLPGGVLIWLDQVWPQYSKAKWKLYGKIGIEISTNHRARSVTILQKVG